MYVQSTILTDGKNDDITASTIKYKQATKPRLSTSLIIKRLHTECKYSHNQHAAVMVSLDFSVLSCHVPPNAFSFLLSELNAFVIS